MTAFLPERVAIDQHFILNAVLDGVERKFMLLSHFQFTNDTRRAMFCLNKERKAQLKGEISRV
jgi:hypothetical protein